MAKVIGLMVNGSANVTADGEATGSQRLQVTIVNATEETAQNSYDQETEENEIHQTTKEQNVKYKTKEAPVLDI